MVDHVDMISLFAVLGVFGANAVLSSRSVRIRADGRSPQLVAEAPLRTLPLSLESSLSPPPHRRGIALCVLSACGFGAMAIFAKEAYAAGVTVVTLLSLRFLLAAALFWAIVVARGTPLPPRRVAAHRPGPRRHRLRRPGRAVLRGADAHRRVADVPAALPLPGARLPRRARDRSRARHGAPARRARRWRPRARRSCCSAASVGALDGLGLAHGARRRGRLRGLHPGRRPRGRAASTRSCSPRWS